MKQFLNFFLKILFIFLLPDVSFFVYTLLFVLPPPSLPHSHSQRSIITP